MMYNYPFFSFPHIRRYPSAYSGYYRNSSFLRRNSINNNNSNNAASISPVSLQRQPSYRKTSNFSNTVNHSNYDTKNEKTSSKKINSSSGFSFLNNFLHQEDRGDDEECFEIFGLKLYYDDILLICLIFFLYQEDVKDQNLFIALILLLLS